MPDSHVHPDDWGIMPILFQIGDFGIPAYSFFVLLGLIVGILFYFRESKNKKKLNDNGLFIAIGALAGGAIGAKLLEVIINFDFFVANFSNMAALSSGRTITGGLIGGMIGAGIAKRYVGSTEKRGNLFAPGIAIGVAIGRIGCFLVGCCYGKPTGASWWGVDFGDHILRHPTQIYEALFMLGMFIYLEKIKNRADVKPGQLFKTLMISYFTFRFLIEFIRVEPVVFIGLTVFQLVSIFVLIYLFRDNIKGIIKAVGYKLHVSKKQTNN